MRKSELVRSVERFKGSGFLNQKELAQYLGVGKDACRSFAEGLEFLKVGTVKLYAAEDIAEKIMESRGEK